MNKSLIVLFDEGPLGLRIDATRREVAQRFGGGAALELPVHLTCFKWASSDIPASLLENVSQHQLSEPVVLGTPVLSSAHRAVWLDVVSDTVGRVHRYAKWCLDNHGVTPNRLEPSPHVTIAYQDYSDRELSEIFAYVTSRSDSLSGTLTARKLAVASDDGEGVWRIVG